MKTIKSPLLGFRKLDDSDSEVLMKELKLILTQHQEILINRLLSNLPAYVDYRFNVKLSKEDVLGMRERLLFLRNNSIDLNMFQEIAEHVRAHTTTHLNNELFYRNIDELLQLHVPDRTLTIN